MNLNPRRSALLVLVLVAAIIAGVVLFTRDDDAADLIALNVPRGWVVSSDGTAVAESQSDLTAASPVGAVVRAEVVGDDAADVDQIVRDLRSPVDVADFGFADPLAQTLHGTKAVSIQTREAGRVRTYISAHPKGRAAVLFTLDAPAVRYESLRATLATIPGLA